MEGKKKFRWLSLPGFLVLLVGCAIFGGDDDDEEPDQTLYVQVAVQSLNVRADPTTSSAIVAKVVQGTVISPVQRSGRWFGVSMTDGSIGWIHGDYLTPAD